MSCSSFNLAIRIKQPPTISDHAPASSNGWSERSRPRATNGGIDLDRALTNPAAAFDEPERSSASRN
jgi:hypothetical protein